MAEANNTPGCSDAHCQLYSILNTPPSYPGHKVISDLPKLNKSQFCEAFFHVPKVLDCNTIMQCLDEDKCRVYTLAKKNPKNKKKQKTKNKKQPKYVVSFVVLKIGNDVKYKALFENCVQQRDEGTKHAEEFFLEDARERELERLASEMTSLNLEGSPGRKVMYMYITLQPCHESITHDRKKGCTKKLIEFYKKNLEPLNIPFIVKPTFIYKAYWSTQNVTGKKKKLIENAREGLEQLRANGIKIQAMVEQDWDFLRENLCSEDPFASGTYEGSEREKLDLFIRHFLDEEIGSGSASSPRGSASPPRDSASPPCDSASTSNSNPPPRDSNPPPRDSNPPPRDSNPPPRDSDPSSSGSDSTASGSDPPPRDSASTPRGSDPPPRDSDPSSSGSDSTASDSDPPPRDSAQQSSDSASSPSDSDSTPSESASTSSDSDPPSRYNGSGGRPKEGKKKDDKKKETGHGNLERSIEEDDEWQEILNYFFSEKEDEISEV